MDSLTWIEAAASLRFWEWCAVVLAFLLAWVAPVSWDKPLQRLESPLKKFARRPLLPVIVIGAAAILLRIALQPLLHTPQPAVHDEFSYLLAADTFLHGRVTNPTHPFWKFFETFHTLQRPTYASMYPPAQGLFLAAGRLLAGHPYAGVLLSIAILSASLFWMLRAWLPPQWALLGGVLAIIRIGLFSYWGNSYWGGAPGAIGGALVAGSIPRIFRQRRLTDAILLGLGLVLLANSRPVEGVFFSIPFGVALVIWALRRPHLREKLARIVLPASVILIAGGAAMAYYNWRITGNPLEPPQVRNMREYSAYGVMLWDKGRPQPEYNNEVMRLFYTNVALSFAQRPHSLAEVGEVLWKKILVLFYFFLGPVLVAPVILSASSLFKKRVRLLLLAFLSLAIGIACQAWWPFPHYFSPATCAIYALVLFAMRDIWKWKWGARPVGHFVVRGFVAVVLLMVVVRIFAEPLGIDVPYRPYDWISLSPENPARASFLNTLKHAPERYLVIVRYAPNHHPDREWVYNDADIDHAKVIWARDLGPETDELVRYFHDRRAVVVEPDAEPPVTYPYVSGRE